LVANAFQVQKDEDSELALLLALAAYGIEDPPEAARRALLDIAYAPATRRRFVTDQPNYGLDVSPNGQMMVSGANDGTVFLWDVASGQLLKRLEGHTTYVLDVAFSPDGRRVLSGSGDQTAILWDVASGQVVHRLTGHTSSVRAVAFGPDGRTALTGENSLSDPGELILWDLDTDDAEARIIQRFGTKEGENRQGVRSVAISPDGRTALVGLSADPPHDRPLVLWDLETFEVLRFFAGPSTAIDEVAISQEGHFGLSSAEGERLISLWNLETGEELLRLEGHEGLARSVAFSPDGRTALSTDDNGVLIWWDLTSGEPLQRLGGHTGGAWGGAWDVDFVDNTSAISSSEDGTLRLWDLTTSFQLDHWGQDGLRHGAAVTALAISPDGQWAISGAGSDARYEPVAADNSLILWDYQTGEALRRLEGHEATVSDVVFGPDGVQALSSSFDGTLILWDLASGKPIRQLEGHTGLVTGVDISSDGRHALSSATDYTIIHWDLTSGQALQRFIGHQYNELGGIVFGAKDRQAISYGWDASLIVWDVASGQRLRRLTGLDGDAGGHLTSTDIVGLSLSPDGRTALSAGGEDRTLYLWDLASGKSIRRFDGHASYVRDIMISPDGRTALSGGWDENLILWDMASGTPLRRLPVSASFEESDTGAYGTRVAIHPDGQTALSGEPDGTILKWQLAEPSPAELIDWIGENRPLRELTCLERETYQIPPLCDEDGVSAATTADLLAAAARSAAAWVPAEPAPVRLPPAAAPLPIRTPQPARPATLGENRSELERHEFDVWFYEGQAGETLTLHMQADKPVTEWIPIEDRFEAGVLDTVLSVIGPDGSLLAFSDDSPSQQAWTSGDSLIEAVYLPVDGQYRIEAQSFLDDLAGGYTLTIESRRVEVNQAILQSYVGTYQNSAGSENNVYLKDDRLYIRSWFDTTVLDPLGETEFIMNPHGYWVIFDKDDEGLVAGYEVSNQYGRFEYIRLEE
ncbi:MAG: WD40 repeat domain-containing protein, partial [Anaerolineae bacterium]